ncbi:MAG: hypothetical protein EHM72_01650 [Calditrichaeota bacterium]|nr:MAG: hypothetical protein EHM72_01650 [Calditrichota bacterium]
MREKILKRCAVKMAALLLMMSTVTAAESSLKAFATNIEPLQSAAYIFKVVFDAPVSPTSHFEVMFPHGFNLNNAVMATSEQLDGMLVITPQDSILIVRRERAEKVILPGSVIELKVAMVLNPAVLANDQQFSIVLKENQAAVERLNSRSAVERYDTQINR